MLCQFKGFHTVEGTARVDAVAVLTSSESTPETPARMALCQTCLNDVFELRAKLQAKGWPIRGRLLVLAVGLDDVEL
jgi:hypothetical protein